MLSGRFVSLQVADCLVVTAGGIERLTPFGIAPVKADEQQHRCPSERLGARRTRAGCADGTRPQPDSLCTRSGPVPPALRVPAPRSPQRIAVALARVPGSDWDMLDLAETAGRGQVHGPGASRPLEPSTV